ncbi:MAG TPA: MBL fold metallo-hydrolase [Gammaproteobacteria bacterium]|nr:MBL fold metallo-hydrolase [Gammaproteobacteria bacterium]
MSTNRDDPRTATRRTVLAGAAGLAALGWRLPLSAQPPPAANRTFPPTGTRLVMLGTRGGPGVSLDRGETASAVVVDGVPYLVDCGYGTMRALVASGLGYQAVNTIFLTHLHDDHTADLAALLAHQWTGTKTAPTSVYGPYATESTVAGALAFFRANVEIRTVDEGRTSKPEELFFGHDLDVGNDPVRVFADERVVVTAATNTHFPERFVAKMQHRSLGYRFETSTRSICFSGDTAYSANIVKLARGADLFVCEVMDHRNYETNMARAKEEAAAGRPENVFRHVAETHVTPADAGRMAREAGVKTIVLNHQVRGQAANGFTISSFIDGVRAEFDGEVIVGEDQQVI